MISIGCRCVETTLFSRPGNKPFIWPSSTMGNHVLVYAVCAMFAVLPIGGVPVTNDPIPLVSTVAPSGNVPKGCQVKPPEVTCNGVNPTDLPAFINSLSGNITSITINSCKVPGQDQVSLDDITFPNLTNLKISTCEVRNISSRPLHGMTNLQTFSIQNNHIKSLPKDIFENLTQLVDVDLSNNDIESLDRSIFQTLGNLSSLDLSNNRLIEFSPVLMSKNMRRLKLSGNTGIKNATLISGGQKTYVCDLDLGYTGITQLPADAFSNLVCDEGNMEARMNISFLGNSFKSVDTKAFEGMGNLKFGRLTMASTRWGSHTVLSYFFQALRGHWIDYLDLSECALSEENVSDFPLLNDTAFLGTLDVSGNDFGPTIKTWPIYVDHVARVHTMQCLNLSTNNFGKGLIFNQKMPNLTELDLTNNHIVIYHDSVIFSQEQESNAPMLKILRMTGAFGDHGLEPGRVKTNVTWFWDLGNLEELYLNNNYKLFDTSINYNFYVMFYNLLNLKNLSLSDTWFGRREFEQVELENFFVDQRKSLLNLKMRNNYMSNKQLVILKGLEKLEVLDLGSNRLGYLYDENWFNMTNLRELDVSNNCLLTISCTDTLTRALDAHLERLWIGDNAYDCTCQLADFRAWLGENIKNDDAHYVTELAQRRKIVVPDINITQCMGPKEWSGRRLLEYHPDWLQCQQRGLIIGLSAGGACLLVLLAITGLVIFFCRLNIHFCLKTWRNKKKGYKKANKKEVFMGYWDGRDENLERNREDDWVNRSINTNLELCRDLPVPIKFMTPIVNKGLGQQIAEEQGDYRFILLIVGELFLQHLWEDIKANVCDNEAVMQQCRKKYVLVLLGLEKKDLPEGMKALWKHGTCFTFRRGRANQDRFWKELKLKLS